MIMPPRTRKLALIAHVTASVGWLGAVGVFLALAIAGLGTRDGGTARAMYLAMALASWFVILPLSIASLLTGLVQSLGTSWGLFRHYWVLIKLLITVLATLILLVHMQAIDRMAEAATSRSLEIGDFRRLRLQLVIDSGAAIVALLAATTLSIYKPRGRTAFGRRAPD